MSMIKTFVSVNLTILERLVKGSKVYYAWLALLSALMLLGLYAYAQQLDKGLILTSMRDQVSWGFYISNFTFLVGVAAAAVLLVIPSYIYHFKPIKEIVLFGELLAIAAISMCIMFILVDMGRPERVWHILPLIGKMNFPSSILAWDVLVLNLYLIINMVISFYAMHTMGKGKDPGILFWTWIKPLIILSIPAAISIHTVTAFLYNGLSSRPFWNASILAPRFLASAFCSGPAIIILMLQIIRRFSKIEIDNKALFKISELIAYAMGINIFLFGAEFFKEFYSGSVHLAPMKYLYFGLHGKSSLVFWMWLALTFNLTAFIIFLLPKLKENNKLTWVNLACVLVIVGVYIEKGMGLIIPGFIPGVLGEIYEYRSSLLEKQISIGIWAAGAMIYTMLLRIAIPLYTGELRFLTEKTEDRSQINIK